MVRILSFSFCALLFLGGVIMISHAQPHREQKKNTPDSKAPSKVQGNQDVGNVPWNVRPLRIRQSKPVIVNDAEFIAVTEAEWKIPRVESDRDSIEIQLRITNRRKTEVGFLTFDAFGIVVKTADGKEVAHDGGRNGTKITRPILMDGGVSYSLCRRAELRRDRGAKSATLFYYDGTGTVESFGPLRAGKYTLNFWYATTQGHPIHDPLMDQQKTPGAVPFWSGKAISGEVPFEVLEGS